MKNSKGIDYIVKYEEQGFSADTSRMLENEVWLDVGNALKGRCFDHHHNEYESALDALVKNYKSLDELKDFKKIIVHLHADPDFDCVASYYAVRYYLENGEEGFFDLFGERGTAYSFVQYINAIDSGRKKNVGYPTLYEIFCALYNGREKSKKTYDHVVENGLELIEEALGLYKKQPENDGVDYFAEHDFQDELSDRFREQIDYIKSDRCFEIYEAEKKDNTISFESIPVWIKDGENDWRIKNLPAAIWTKVPAGPNGYAFARKEGNCITIVPDSRKGFDGAKKTRVFVSVHMDNEDTKNCTLIPLAEVIEQMEQIEEQRLYEISGIYRRDHSRPREAKGYLGNIPFSVTSDPWYAKPDFFRQPRKESILRYEDILGIIRNNAGAVKKSYVLDIGRGSQGCDAEYTMIPLSLWQRSLKSKLKEANTHLVIWGELDAALVSNNNRILEAYCMNIAGRAFLEKKDTNIFFLNYRTCIYSDLNCTILLVAAYDGYDISDAFADTLSAESLKEFERSPLISDIRNIVEQRNDLIRFGERIGTLKENERDKIEKLNRDLLLFSVRTQREDIKSGLVERELYSFIKRVFGITELKSSIMEEMGIIINESRDKSEAERVRQEKESEENEKKRDEKIQAGVGLFALLSISSALVDIFDFVYKFSAGEIEGSWGWLLHNHHFSVLWFEIAAFALTLFIAGLASVYAFGALWNANKDNIKRIFKSLYDKVRPGKK